MNNIPEETLRWAKEFREWWGADHNDTSQINRAYAWQGYLKKAEALK